MSSKSLYDVLGVQKSDSCSEIKKAYLKLAKTHHPDKGGDPEKFKEILRASEILSDEGKRRMYDEMGVIDGEGSGVPPGGFPGSGFSFPFEVNLNDLFGNMFGNPPVGQRGPVRKGKKAPPATQNISLTLEQFYLGHNFEININRQSFCTNCEHSGATSKETCKNCNGKGAVSQVVQMGPMTMHTTGPCLDCQGKGEKVLVSCTKCSGTGFLNEKRNLAVKVAPGTRVGETFIFPEVCSDHPGFERPGDAQLTIMEDTNDNAFKVFKRIGDRQQDLETTVVISLAESLIGCTVLIDEHPGFIDGLYIKIPAGSFKGDRYCLTGAGMPIFGDIGKYGDLFVVVDVVIKPFERTLLATEGRDLLKPLFEGKIRECDLGSESEPKEMYLTK